MSRRISLFPVELDVMAFFAAALTAAAQGWPIN
jgi:hypothetical protein